MPYYVVEADTIAQLILRVNEYEAMHYLPTGSPSMVRERVNGSVKYIQGMYQNGNGVKTTAGVLSTLTVGHRKRGRPKGSFKHFDPNRNP
jgi:hypothetical protein